MRLMCMPTVFLVPRPNAAGFSPRVVTCVSVMTGGWCCSQGSMPCADLSRYSFVTVATCNVYEGSLRTVFKFITRPAHIHRKAIFRLPLSAGCVQTLLRFRMGCHNLPWDLGRRQGIPRLHRVRTLCAGENPGDEQHVVFECPGLQDIRDRYQGLFGEHATTMLQFMWQDDMRGVAMFIKECLGVYYGTDPYGGQASDQP